jgi:phage terminase small subunit
MPKDLTDRQMKFAQNIFSGMTQAQAYIKAGYAKNSAVTVNNNASRLAKKELILQYLTKLREKAESRKVMSAIERRERLSEIARTNLTQFMELGQDGSWVNLGEETKSAGAIQEIHSRTEYDDNGAHPTVYTSIKLHDPIRAIDLLNKMDGIYSDKEKQDINVKVNVAILQAKDLTDDELAEIASKERKIINADNGITPRSGDGITQSQTSAESSTSLLPIHDAEL